MWASIDPKWLEDFAKELKSPHPVSDELILEDLKNWSP